MATYTNKTKLIKPDPGKCNWDWDWYRNAEINDAIASQLMQGNFVVSGGVLSGASGLNINIDDTVASVDGVEHSISAGTHSLTGAVANPEERNWFWIDNTGTLQVTTTAPSGSFALIGLVDTDVTSVARQSDLRQEELDISERTPVENLFINGRFEHNQRWGIGGDAYVATAGTVYTADRFTHRSNGFTSKTSFDGDGDPLLILRHDTLTRANFAICQPFRIVPLNNSRFRVGDKLTLAFEIHPEDGGVGDPAVYLDAHFSSSILTIVRPQTIVSDVSTISIGLYTRVVATITIVSLPDDADTALFVSFGCEYASPAAIGTKVFFKNTTLIDGDKDLPVRRRTEEEELDFCLDYYVPLGANRMMGGGATVSGTEAQMFFPLGRKMVRNPTAENVAGGVVGLYLQSHVGQLGLTGMAGLTAAKDGILTSVTVAGGLTAGFPVCLRTAAGGTLAFNAEI